MGVDMGVGAEYKEDEDESKDDKDKECREKVNLLGEKSLDNGELTGEAVEG